MGLGTGFQVRLDTVCWVRNTAFEVSLDPVFEIGPRNWFINSVWIRFKQTVRLGLDIVFVFVGDLHTVFVVGFSVRQRLNLDKTEWRNWIQLRGLKWV